MSKPRKRRKKKPNLFPMGWSDRQIIRDGVKFRKYLKSIADGNQQAK